MTDLIETARALIEPLTGYTPGPWDASGLTVYDTCMDGVASCHADADARLIAAAPDLRDMVATLADALEAERAKVAAAYGAAATWLVGTGIAGDGDGDPLASCIRAIPPANAQAALDKLLIEARLEGWRFGRDEVVKWLIASGVAGDHDSDPLVSSIREMSEPNEKGTDQ